MLDHKNGQERGPDAPGGVAEAMNRVLAAERAALADLEACRSEAERTLEAGRREARAILEHAERVASEIHARTGHLAARRARQLVRAARDARAGAADENRVAVAIRRLAAQMTGGDDA